MSVTRMRAFEADFNNSFVVGCSDAIGQTGMTYETVMADFIDKGYAAAVDIFLNTKHAKKIMLEDQLEHTDPEDETSDIWAQLTVEGYLFERAPWIRQQMAYIAAEYNPIENYSQHEEETIDYDRKKKTRDITNQEKPYSRQRSVSNPQVITEQYTEANIVSQVSQTATTVEQQTAPFESSSYFNQNKTTETPGTVTNTEQPYNRKFKTPANTVTETESLQAAKEVTQKIEDAAYIDQDTRELDRSGNIGVQTAAQMMAFDSEFWDKNRWLSKIAEDIVNLICEEVSFAL